MKFFTFFRAEADTAFERLMKPHFSYLYRLAYRFCGNQHDAEDLIQDMLVKLYPRAVEMAGIEKLRPWLVTVLYRMFVSGARHRQRSPVDLVENEQALHDSVASDTLGPEGLLMRHQNVERIQACFERLPEEQRIALVLHDMEGFRLVELEAMLAIPLGTLKSRVHRARARMRELLVGQ